MVQKSSSSCGLNSYSELLCIVLRDVAITPDVEMMLLGLLHRIIVFFHHLGELSSSLLVHQEETVLDESFADVLISNVHGNKYINSSPRKMP